MKKFNFRGVLDGFRSTVNNSGSVTSSTPKSDCACIEETIWSEHFQIAKTVRHGFPYQPTAMAYDPVQNLVAIGTKSGSIRIFGQPGVDCHVQHDVECAVIQLLFLVNEGALVSVCADDQLHLWTLRQKKPEIVHSLKFQRERITCCHLPFQSKWMYVGTERGNVHFVNLESFVLSGYVINWNKAIELLRKTHPGPVVHLSDNQSEPNKLLIGFETGLVVLWDLKEKAAEHRYNYAEGLRSVAWHHEGKQFVCSHTDGSLVFWNTRSPLQPATTSFPHSKVGRDGVPEPCRAILKVDLRTTRNGEPFVIFSGGMPYEKTGHTPAITIMRGTSITVLEMEYPVVDFITICSTPWNNDFQDPTAVIVLLQRDFIVIDLLTPGYPCFENPYQMDLHESPVTTCVYFADCPPDLIPAFYSVRSRQMRKGYSNKDWPITGGDWGTATCSYSEIIVTGHADGSVKFWDSSVVSLQVLYMLKTAKFLDANKCHCADASDFPFAVQHVMLCVDSRLLCIAGVSHVILLQFSKLESMGECTVIEVNIASDPVEGLDSPDADFDVIGSQRGSISSYSQTPPSVTNANTAAECQTCIKVKNGPRKWTAGYQPVLCCVVTHVDGDSPPPIMAVCVNSVFGLLAFSNDNGLVIVDIIQKCCLVNVSTPDLYGSLDPFCRAPRSRTQPDGLYQVSTPDDYKLPTVEQPSAESEEVTSKSQIAVQSSSLVLTPQQINHSLSHDKDESKSIEELGIDSADHVKAVEDPPQHQSKKNAHVQLASEKKQVENQVGPVFEKASLMPPSQETLSEAGKNIEFAKRSPVAPPHRRFKKLHISLQERSPAATSVPNINESMQFEAAAKLVLKVSKSADTLKHSSNHHTVFDSHSQDSMPNTLSNGLDVGDGAPQTPTTAPVLLSHKGDGMGLIVKMNRKLRNCLRITSRPGAEGGSEPHVAETKSVEGTKMREIQLLDLTSDDLLAAPVIQKLTYAELTHSDKSDGLLCRSQSSSTSSWDNLSVKETIQCLTFAETFARKSDVNTCPCLWVGTNVGSVLIMAFAIPSADQRSCEAVAVSSTGTVFRLKGEVLSTTFLDYNGCLIPTPDDQWRDTNQEDDQSTSKDKKPYTRNVFLSNSKVRGSTASGTNETSSDRQFAVICSEKQARVISLPSQSTVYKVKITETSVVARADVISVKDSVCLACFLLNGHIVTFSLPSLKPLFDDDHLPHADTRVLRTFCFSSYCHALYFNSPTELQKITLSAEVCETLNEMLGELFLPRDMPEAPKQGFFKNLFSIGSSTLDREELFSEAKSGKASKSVAKYTSGIGQAQEMAGTATSAISYAKMAAIERGERLSELEERTAQMCNEAEEYSKIANQLKAKYRDKKWYQL